MLILLEPDKHTILESDEFLDINYAFQWKPCAGDPNVGKTYTKFMMPIRRKVESGSSVNITNPCICDPKPNAWSAEYRQCVVCGGLDEFESRL